MISFNTMLYSETCLQLQPYQELICVNCFTLGSQGTVGLGWAYLLEMPVFVFI